MSFMLEGLRVLDFSRLLPGPFATLLLADMGADVIKIEDTTGGDYARYYPPMAGDVSAFFQAVNRNKRSLTLNLKSEQGVEVAKALIKTADVVIESFRPGVMAKLGLAPADAVAIKPDIVYCSISGYGQTGAFASRAGHDLNYMAHAGLLAQNGTSERINVPGFQVADIAGGALYAALGITSALFRRERTGEGAVLDISMTEGALSLALPLIAMHACHGETAPGRGMLTGGIAAYNIYVTKDNRHLAVGSLEPKFWAGFLAVIGAPHLMDRGHRDDVEAQDEVQSIVATRTLAEWVDAFEPADVCVEPILNLDELLASELHRTREVFFELSGVQHARTPLTPLREHTPAPALGQHTEALIAELGLSYDALRASNAI